MKGKVDNYFIILDTKDFGTSNLNLSFTKDSLQIMQNYYAERQYKMRVVNSGYFVRTCYKLVQPIINRRTLDKVYFFQKIKF